MTIFAGAAVVVLPWMFYVDIRFHDEFVQEQSAIVNHLDSDVEGWAGPWDRVMFDYCVGVFHVYYPAVLAAGIIVLVRAVRRKEMRLWIVLIWAMAVFVPNLLATSKTVSATLIGWPALWLMFGYLVSRAIGGDRLALGTWLVAMLVAVTLINGKSIPTQGWGYGPGGFASIMRENFWVVWQMAAAISGGIVFLLVGGAGAEGGWCWCGGDFGCFAGGAMVAGGSSSRIWIGGLEGDGD